MNREPLLPPVPIRFSTRTRGRLVKASKDFSLTLSEIIRQAVEQQLQEWERTGEVTIKHNNGS